MLKNNDNLEMRWPLKGQFSCRRHCWRLSSVIGALRMYGSSGVCFCNDCVTRLSGALFKQKLAPNARPNQYSRKDRQHEHFLPALMADLVRRRVAVIATTGATVPALYLEWTRPPT
jgi:hypothetical protein